MALEIPDNWGLTAKVAVVTGGGAAGDGIGNGRAAAILLSRAGANVVVVDLDGALAQRTVAMIEEAGGKAVAVQADVTRAADCAAIVKTALDQFGRLDLLDNNVGIGSRGTVIDETEENWRRVMQVNVDTMFLMAKHAIPAMRRAGGGAIVNVSSISALRPRGLTVYSVSKGAVIALTRAMAVDHGRENIRVNCVAPGPVWTPLNAVDKGASKKKVAEFGKKTPLERPAQPEEIAPAYVFLASDADSSFITGVVLPVLGGETVGA